MSLEGEGAGSAPATTWDGESACPKPLAEAVRRLVAGLRPERIYLFGSRARGDAIWDSDYDLMVIVAESEQPSYRRAQEGYGLLWGIGIPIDLLIWTKAEFDRQVPVMASLPATIMREGRLLYAA